MTSTKTLVSGRKVKNFVIHSFRFHVSVDSADLCRKTINIHLCSGVPEMPFFKVWSENKAIRKGVSAENYPELVSKGKVLKI